MTALCSEQEPALIKHPHVDPSRIVLVGRSFGGLLGDLGQHLDDPAADAQFEALLTIPALRTFLAPCRN